MTAAALLARLHRTRLTTLVDRAWHHTVHHHSYDVIHTVALIEARHGDHGMRRLLCATADRVTAATLAAAGLRRAPAGALIVPAVVGSDGAALDDVTDAGHWCASWCAARAARDHDRMRALLAPLGACKRREMACALLSRAVASVAMLEQKRVMAR